MIKLYNIYYIDTNHGNERIYEDTTDNFKEWLNLHNEERVADGNDEEKADYFEVQEIHPILFNEGSK
tara:strand:+ start:270 stop:470 length:201 start_codon:yes stop_codon:yes gene_type:complete